MLIIIEHYKEEYLDQAKKVGFDFQPWYSDKFYHENTKTQSYRCEVDGKEVVLIRAGYGLNYSLAVVDYLSYVSWKKEEHLLDGSEMVVASVACFSPSEYCQDQYKIGEIVTAPQVLHLESKTLYPCINLLNSKGIATSQADQLWGGKGDAFDLWYYGWEHFEKVTTTKYAIELSDYSVAYGVHAAQMSGMDTIAIGFIRETYYEGHQAISSEQKIEAYYNIFQTLYNYALYWKHPRT